MPSRTTKKDSPRNGASASTTWKSSCHGVTRTVSANDTNSVTARHWQCQPMTLARVWCVLALTVLLTASCDERQGMLPPSGGKLYEVLLVGDKDGIVKRALGEDTPGLPQSEPQFDVSAIDSGKFNPSVSAVRNIVMVNVSPQLYTNVRLRYEKDVWAHPQMVIHVNAPSAKMLNDSIGRIAPTLLRLLNRSEIKKNVSMLKSKRNIKAEKLVRQMFGIEMWIPMEMASSKRGKDFLWLSNNSPTMMKNIVIYHSRGIPFSDNRDQVLGRNIKGETDSMYMQTVRPTVTFEKPFIRGLWEMKNDDMGGPFVSVIIRPTKQGGPQTVVEGFIFAPGKKKRNAIRQLEAVLSTIRLDKL